MVRRLRAAGHGAERGSAWCGPSDPKFGGLPRRERPCDSAGVEGRAGVDSVGVHGAACRFGGFFQNR